LDADDVLMPTCIETHICVHLSSRIHVGFTACDMMQATGDGDVIVGTGEAMSGHLRGWRGRGKSISRPCLAESDWPTAGISEKMSAKIRYVPPSWTKWIWSPTSGLCFRRDAISLFADNGNLRDLRAGTDAYFAHGVGAWCGSILIDEPLFIYRIHHTNVFSRSVQLNNVLNFDPRGPGDYNAKAKLALTGQFIRHCARFSHGQILRKVQLAAVLFRFNGMDEDPSRPPWARRSYVARHLVEHRDRMAAEFGKPATYLLMLAFGVPLSVIWRCWQPSA
jgi:hypothetical protein